MSTHRRRGYDRQQFMEEARLRIIRMEYLANCLECGDLGHAIAPCHMNGYCEFCGEIDLNSKLNPFENSISTMPRCPYADF